MKKTLGIMSSKPGGRTRFLTFAKAALQVGFEGVLVFRPDDVDLKQRKISGYRFKNGAFVRSVQAFPDLLYDVGYYRSIQGFQKAEEVKAYSRIPFVGDWLGNKWVVHQALSASSECSEYLLNTKLLICAADGISMLDRYEVIMLKPINGDSGTGIKRLSQANGIVVIEEDGGPKRQVQQESVAKYLEQLSPKGYIIQPWINLCVKSTLPWDCRVLVQKDELGHWGFTGLVVRVGQTSHITTNLENGGEAQEAFSFLSHRFSEEVARTLYARIRLLSNQIALQLETYFDRCFAEFGIDLAIDENQQIRILEINHKPGKRMMKVEDDKDLYAKGVRMAMKYAAYLANSDAAVSKASLPWSRDTEGQTNEQIIEQIIEDGMSFYRTPYRFGAKPWSIDAFDCSSFMQLIFARNGLRLPRTSREQSQLGYEIAKRKLRMGDLLFFSVESRANKKGLQRIGHVGIYCGNNRFLHSCKLGGVIQTDLSDPLWERLYVKACRVFEKKDTLESSLPTKEAL